MVAEAGRADRAKTKRRAGAIDNRAAGKLKTLDAAALKLERGQYLERAAKLADRVRRSLEGRKTDDVS